MVKGVTQKIVIVGCGNVAWHLAKHLHTLGNYAIHVYNHRANANLIKFKTDLKCKTLVGLDNILNDADIYIVCVSDQHISSVSARISCKKATSVILHTSGSAKISDLINSHGNKAVMYPLQTFSKKDQITWHEVPLMMEASNKKTKSVLDLFAKQFSDNCFYVDFKKRLKFHLAAVMVNNFTNALYVAAAELVGHSPKADNFNLLLPLIKQTSAKLQRLKPIEAQTGPAKRKDTLVMKKHLDLLSKQNDLVKIYKNLSAIILKQQSHAKL